MDFLTSYQTGAAPSPTRSATRRGRRLRLAGATTGRAGSDLTGAVEREPELLAALLHAIDDAPRRHAEAIAQVGRQAAARQPRYADLLLVAARATHAAGDRLAAERLVTRALEINPRYAAALIFRARLAGEQNRTDDARADLLRVVEFGGDYPDVHLALGRIDLQQGQHQAARRRFERAVALNPRFAAAREALAALDAADGGGRET
jgi:tetratricopeptide (TPR) repeat protein